MKIETAGLKKQELHDLLGNSIAPLPVALISTIGQDGTFNAAPFSFIAPVCSKPPIICVSFGRREGQKKDTLKNLEFSLDFVINVVDEALIKQAVQTAKDYPSSVDEIKEVGLTAVSSERIKSPRIAESRVSLECKLVQELELLEEKNLRTIVFGEVVMAHINDDIWVNGWVEPSRLKAVGRVGKDLYHLSEGIVELKRS